MNNSIELITLYDFDEYFTDKVDAYIGLLDKSKVDKILITAGPYRSYGMAIHYIEPKVVHIDFYSALRVGFGSVNYKDLVDWINNNSFDPNNSQFPLGCEYVWRWMCNQSRTVPISAFILNRLVSTYLDDTNLICNDNKLRVITMSFDNWISPSKIKGKVYSTYDPTNVFDVEWNLNGVHITADNPLTIKSVKFN